MEFGRDPPTDSENDPRAATSLSAPLVKKLFGLVSCVVPGVSEASCTKSRPFNGSCATCCEVMTCPKDGLVVSTATAVASTSICDATAAGASVKSSTRASSTCNLTALCSVV